MVPGESPLRRAVPDDRLAVAVAPPGLAVTTTVASCQGHVVVSGTQVTSAMLVPAAAVMEVGEVTVSQIQSRPALTLA